MNADIVGLWELFVELLDRIMTWLVFVMDKDLEWGDIDFTKR